MSDGTTSYTYGLGRISQTNTTTEYFLGDALGSVRQLTSQSGQVTYAKSYDPYGAVTQTSGAGQSAYGYTGEQQDPSGMVYLRARYYSPLEGRFFSRDTWGGDDNSPQSLNRWNYTQSNPINYTDPSGHCIFTGVDTVACLIALAIGIPVVAGVTTAAYDFSITQSGGVGGHNADSRDCIDFSQVLLAGEGGTLGALNSEGEILSTLILFPTYIMAYLVHGKSPAEVNMNILSDLGLDDEYRSAMSDPNFVAGKWGGDAGITYISLASFFKGLPTSFTVNSTPLIINTALQNNGALSYVVINLPTGIQAIGANGQLVYLGIAKFGTQLLSASDGGGGGGEGRPSSNIAQNRQFKGAVKEIERQIGRPLTKFEIRRLHDSIHHLEDPGFWDIVNEGLSLFGD